MFHKESLLREWFADKRVLIAGYGREGRSSERLLSHLLPASQYAVADGNDAILRQAPHYDIILKSPGIPTRIFENTVDAEAVSSQTDVFLGVYGQQTIGITGTKGKSTTTELLYEILSQHLPVGSDEEYARVIKAGNMGIPLFDIAPQLTDDTLVVAELSCHQLENIHRAPHISLLLNLFQEHLDHYNSYEAYKRAKLNIVRCQSAGDHFIYCEDNKELNDMVEQMRPTLAAETHACSVRRPFECRRPEALRGDHNLSNLTLAACAARLTGVSDKAIAETIGGFCGLRYRMEYVGTFCGIRFYNDSISTIPEAAIAAVEATPDVETLIMGGLDRGIDYKPLADYLASSQIRNMAFVGAAGRRIYEMYKKTLGQQRDPRTVVIEDDYRAIVTWCFEHTTPGKACLLSPAAASYDAFKNFEERGALFNELIQNYRQK